MNDHATIIDMPAAKVTGAYATAATSKGSLDGSASRQWASRPADQRFTTLDSLFSQVNAWANASTTTKVDPHQIRVIPQADNGLRLALPSGALIDTTHWSMGQVCNLTDTPARYLRKLPAKLAAVNLQYGLMNREAGDLSAYAMGDDDGDLTLRAMTSGTYGRILDRDVVSMVMDRFGDDPTWKVPGMIDWSSSANGVVKHNPFVDVTLDNTTLYASDRDVWVFLCQDAHPIEVGKLPDGSPDLMFRGVIISNSEVGAQAFKVRTMLLRGVCFNRNLWGVEDASEFTIRHTAKAPEKFAEEIVPALASYGSAGTAGIVEQVKAAKALKLAKDEEERLAFLMEKADLSKKKAEAVLEQFMAEEGHPAENLWDFVQALTAAARGIEHTDARIKAEEAAGDLMKKAA